MIAAVLVGRTPASHGQALSRGKATRATYTAATFATFATAESRILSLHVLSTGVRGLLNLGNAKGRPLQWLSRAFLLCMCCPRVSEGEGPSHVFGGMLLGHMRGAGPSLLRPLTNFSTCPPLPLSPPPASRARARAPSEAALLCPLLRVALRVARAPF